MDSWILLIIAWLLVILIWQVMKDGTPATDLRYKISGYKTDLYAVFNDNPVPVNLIHVQAFKDGSLTLTISFSPRYQPIIDELCLEHHVKTEVI